MLPNAEDERHTDKITDAKRFLPKFYNGTFDRNEAKSIDQLADMMETSPKKGGRRRLTN